ncbi:MAG: type II toxin-antitoxin system RelE/ParE family toxin [Coriobacteriia bacterium]
MLDSSFHEDARTEFDEAADFYGMERASLGLAFVGAVEGAVDHVREYPDSCPIIRSRVRKARVRRFPYSIMYSVVGERIRVLAVAHDRRRPYYWSGRR